MSIFSARKAYLPLKTDVPYKVVLQGWDERMLETPTESGITAFIAFKFKLLADGREVTDSRSFPVGSDILASQLIVQLNDESLNAMSQEDLFQMCIDKQVQFDMWIERRVVGDDSYTNHHFRKFMSKPEQTATATPATVANFK